MKKIHLLSVALLATTLFYGQGLGSIAFIAYNGDGDDDFAIVLLEEISASTLIYFTDKAPNSTGDGVEIGTSEGLISWNTGSSAISAGTVVVFTDVDQATNIKFGASVGTLSYVDTGLTLSATGDTLYACLGNPQTESVIWLAGIRNNNVEDTNVNATGLIEGTTLVEMKDTASGVDGGKYTDVRSGKINFSDYLVSIANPSNWANENDNGELILPISTVSFTIATAGYVENQIEGFSVYPNPVVNGDFKIISTSNAVKQVSVFNMLGEQVYGKTVNTNETVEVSNLTTGIYIINVEEEGKIATKKLVIK